MTDPCERCEPLFFDLDMEWASTVAEMGRQRNKITEALLDVCAQCFDRFDFDALALPAVRAALGEDRTRALRLAWRDARATVDADG